MRAACKEFFAAIISNVIVRSIIATVCHGLNAKLGCLIFSMRLVFPNSGGRFFLAHPRGLPIGASMTIRHTLIPLALVALVCGCAQSIPSYRANRGLQIERLIYGFGHKSGFYIVNSEAPSLHYFPENRNTFIETVNSFRLVG